MHQLNFPQSLGGLIECSLAIYKQLEDSLVSLNTNLQDTHEIVNSGQIKIFLELQARCESIDTDIMKVFHQNSSDISPALQEKIDQRTQLMKNVFTLNKSFLPRVLSMKALLQHELHNLSSGRDAVKGYTIANKQDKSYFCNSC